LACLLGTSCFRRTASDHRKSAKSWISPGHDQHSSGDQRGRSADKIGKQPLEPHRAGEQETRLNSQSLGVCGFSGEQDKGSNCQGGESINASVTVCCGMKMVPPANQIRQLSFRNGERAEPVEIWKARKFIDEYSDEELGLTKVAKSVNISANHLSEKFKEVTGVNFVDYIARTRTEKARERLQNSNLRISEIAFAVGFQSLSQFNRVFKKLTGKSPSAYRAARAKRTRCP
jgi:AraC-like DNA-binding protein